MFFHRMEEPPTYGVSSAFWSSPMYPARLSNFSSCPTSQWPHWVLLHPFHFLSYMNCGIIRTFPMLFKCIKGIHVNGIMVSILPSPYLAGILTVSRQLRHLCVSSVPQCPQCSEDSRQLDICLKKGTWNECWVNECNVRVRLESFILVDTSLRRPSQLSTQS